MSDGRVDSPRYSVIIPVGERIDELDVLLEEYDQAMRSTGRTYELIVVLSGRKSAAMEFLSNMCDAKPHLRVLELARDFGESAALSSGFHAALGEWFLTLPAYYQVAPTEIPRLIEAGENGADMLIAIRPRKGASFDKLRRRAFHALFRFTSGMRFRDLGCGVRLLKHEVAEEVALYGDQHRFFPALARRRGFRVREVELTQSPKDMFRGRYRLREYLHRFLDIFTVFFLVRFTKKPLRFFGTIGFVAAGLGGLFTLVLVVQRLVFGIPLADRPALLLATLLIVLGVQTFALGLLGELIIFSHAGESKEYSIRRVIQGGSSRPPDSPSSTVEPMVGGRRA